MWKNSNLFGSTIWAYRNCKLLGPFNRESKHGYIDVVKFLAPLKDNPNAREFKDGDGSSSIAMNTEIRRFLESFKKPSKNF